MKALHKVILSIVLVGSVAWLMSMAYEAGYATATDEMHGLLTRARVCVWEHL